MFSRLYMSKRFFRSNRFGLFCRKFTFQSPHKNKLIPLDCALQITSSSIDRNSAKFPSGDL